MTRRRRQAGARDARDARTQFFYELTPERILDAVEAAGLATTGRCLALNSMENRVYDIEVEPDGPVNSPSDRFRVAKFYRPGRWSREQIRAEHEFLAELAAEEIPVLAPVPLADGDTIGCDDATGILYAVFPRKGGRVPDDLGDEELRRVGRLLARVHAVGARRDAPERIRLDPDSYGWRPLEFLSSSGRLGPAVEAVYRDTVSRLLEAVEPWFDDVAWQRIHGDCHAGNLLWGSDGLFLVDFDDMVRGPCVQDLWLLAAGDDAWSEHRRELLLEGYEQIRDFDRRSLRLVPALRALRMVHFSAWIARRWEDPAFPRVFPDFGDDRYWFDELASLREILGRVAGDG